MKFRKSLALILAAQMLLASLAACSKDPATETQAPAGETGNTPAVTETKAPETSALETSAPETEAPETKFDRNSVSDNLPEKDFGGKDYRFLVHERYAYQFYSEDTSGIGLDAEIYDRNKRVEDRFGVKIGYLATGMEDIAKQLGTYVASSEHVAEVLAFTQARANLPPMWYCVLPWYNIGYIDFEQPWWDKRSIEDYTFGQNCFSISGDLALNSIQGTWCLAVNNDLMAELGYTKETLNQLVWDGEWTLDKMIEMTSEAWIDENGDGAKDDGDKFGFGSPVNSAVDGLDGEGTDFFGTANVPWVTAMGEQVLTMNEDHLGLTNTIFTEKLVGVLETLVDYHNNANGVTMTCVDKTFADGKIGLYTTKLDYFPRYNSVIDFETSLMPLPKYDKAQEEYATLADWVMSMFGVPLTVPAEDYDMVGIILEAMSAETWKQVYPAYYEEALKGRYSTDEEMAKMIDLIADSRRFEYATSCSPHFPDSSKLPITFNILIQRNSTDLASVMEQYGDHINQSIRELMAFHNVIDRTLIPEGMDMEEWIPGLRAYFEQINGGCNFIN